jgi:hypothetical protein
VRDDLLAFARGGYITGPQPWQRPIIAALSNDYAIPRERLLQFIRRTPPSYPPEAWVATIGVEPPTFEVRLSRIDIVMKADAVEVPSAAAKLLKERVESMIESMVFGRMKTVEEHIAECSDFDSLRRWADSIRQRRDVLRKIQHHDVPLRRQA